MYRARRRGSAVVLDSEAVGALFVTLAGRPERLILEQLQRLPALGLGEVRVAQAGPDCLLDSLPAEVMRRVRWRCIGWS